VAPEHDDAARQLLENARSAGLRAVIEVDGSLGARIRTSRQRRDCVLAVVGEKEVATRSVQITDIAAAFRGAVATDDVVDLLSRAHAARARDLPWPRTERRSNDLIAGD
jgi:threonyl-tRNA synthetase